VRRLKNAAQEVPRVRSCVAGQAAVAMEKYVDWATSIIPEGRPWRPLLRSSCDQNIGTIRRLMHNVTGERTSFNEDIKKSLTVKNVKSFAMAMLSSGKTHKYASDQVS